LQIAALWVIINATAETSGTQRLPEDKFGLIEWLTQVSQRPNIDLDLHDRVLTVLNIFRSKTSANTTNNNTNSSSRSDNLNTNNNKSQSSLSPSETKNS
jgi:hypothetical protein